MTKHASNPANPLTLRVFVNLVGPKAIPKSPPVPFPGSPDPRTRLRNFERAYREQNAGPQGADFPLAQVKQAWLDSFDAYERIVMLAHAARRQEGAGDRRQAPEQTTEPEPAQEPAQEPAADHEYAVESMAPKADEPEPEPMFAGGESGGGGGGSTFTEAAGAQQAAIEQQAAESVAESAPEPLSESLGAPEPVESAPVETPANEPTE